MLILIGFLAGVLSSMGVGGGTLLVPVLVYFFHTPQITAQGVIMLIFIPTAAVALFTHYKNGYLRLDLAVILAIGAFFGAFLGAWLANTLPDVLLRRIFGIFLLISGIEQLFHKNSAKAKKE